jgi:hypothetical protein
LPSTASTKVDSFSTGASPHIVILVHGIRDFALWQSEIRSVLEEEGFKVEATNYGRVNLFQFLLPIAALRQRPIEELWKQIRIVKQNNEGALLSIVAHSFGTYVIARLMEQKFDARFHRIIFCGSVVRYGFPFEQFQNRFSSPILNEVGTRDIWPAIAESITTGYGSAGTYGFRRPLVRDRWHDGAHHGFFLSGEFCQKFWVPFLKDGAIRDGVSSPEKPRVWIRLISVLKLKYLVLATPVLIAAATSLPLNNSLSHKRPQAVSDAVVDRAPLHLSYSAQRIPGYRVDSVSGIETIPLSKFYAAGAVIRLMLQTRGSNTIVQLDRAEIELVKLDDNLLSGIKYSFDPTRQPGFGIAQPRSYFVRAESASSGSAFFIDDSGKPFPSEYPNLLPKAWPFLRLDMSSGLQETMDINLLVAERGLYETRIKVEYVSDGQRYSLATEPIFIAKL